MLRRSIVSLCALAGLAPAVPSAAQNPEGDPPRVYGGEPIPYGPVRRRIGIFIPPIGRFGGFSANIGGGHVDINVGPSGYGPYGAPAFGGVQVNVHRPDAVYGPAGVYGYGIEPGAPWGAPSTGPHPYLGCVGADCDPDLGPSQLAPTPEPDRESSPSPSRPKVASPPVPGLNAEPDETVVPRRVPSTNPGTPPRGRENAPSGPQLPPPPPQSSTAAPRLFPTSGGPRLIPPGFVPNNGFDVDRDVRPSAPVLPGDDPFGPSRPRPNPNDPLPPAT